jgi:hypothetical protein
MLASAVDGPRPEPLQDPPLSAQLVVVEGEDAGVRPLPFSYRCLFVRSARTLRGYAFPLFSVGSIMMITLTCRLIRRKRLSAAQRRLCSELNCRPVPARPLQTPCQKQQQEKLDIPKVYSLISLGVPFGSEEFVQQQLAEREEAIDTYCDKIANRCLLDPEVGLRLLTKSAAAKSSYHMRLLPPSITKQEATACSAHLRRTMRGLLGEGLGPAWPRDWRQLRDG